MKLIVATDLNGCIGKQNTIPWDIPEELKHFKNTTLGHTVIMGRVTWESIPKKYRPLPGRNNVVITRQKDYIAEGATVYNDLIKALRKCDKNSFIIGGSEIYKQSLPYVNEIIHTVVHREIKNGDAFFTFNPTYWKLHTTTFKNGWKVKVYTR